VLCSDSSASRKSKRAIARAVVAAAKERVKLDNAVLTLQKAWRTIFKWRTTFIYVKHGVKNAGLNEADIRALNFEGLVNHLKSPPIVAQAKKMFSRLRSQARHRHSDVENVGDGFNVRVLLAAYMISFRSTHVFESFGTTEARLLVTAKKMVASMEDITSRYVAGGKGFTWQMIPSEVSKGFLELLRDYSLDFRRWKVPDEARLSQRIRHALVALYNAQGHLPADEPANSPLNLEFNVQIGRLRAKLLQIAGQTALNRFDEERAAGEGFFRELAAHTAVVNTTEAIRGNTRRLTNEHLTHELLLDAGFQLSEDGLMSVEIAGLRGITDIFHRAFWASLTSDLTLEEPCYVRVYDVLEEIRRGVSDLGGDAVVARLADAVDMDHIKEQVTARLFTWDSIVGVSTALSGMVRELSCEERKADFDLKWTEIHALLHCDNGVEARAGSFVSALEFLLTRTNLCRIDFANARLRLIAPTIAVHGVDYERNKFSERVRDGVITMDNTTNWIAKTLSSANELVDRVLNGVAGSILEAHARAVTLLSNGSIYSGNNELSAEVVPETLTLDFHRIVGFRREFKSIVHTSMALFVASGNRIAFAEVSAAVDAMASGSAIVPAELPLSDELKVVLTSSMESTSPMHMVLSDRFTSIITGRIMGRNNGPRRVSIAPVVLPPNVQERADKFVAQVVAVADLNRKVHGEIYNELFPTIARAVMASQALGVVVV
jgi:hypothetical protein